MIMFESSPDVVLQCLCIHTLSNVSSKQELLCEAKLFAAFSRFGNTRQTKDDDRCRSGTASCLHSAVDA